ncbi:hypothetical protein [Clostridium sp.]|uniref:hypothetical protein n=1 Tax=Clostridium sp. TaxID=1506 RepID=UPI0032179EA1
MFKCTFLSTYDEYVECSKECTLYNWAENDNKCPFTELRSKGKKVRNIYDYDLYKEDKSLPVSIAYKDNYL